jgi:hypothetical protein
VEAGRPEETAERRLGLAIPPIGVIDPDKSISPGLLEAVGVFLPGLMAISTASSSADI